MPNFPTNHFFHCLYSFLISSWKRIRESCHFTTRRLGGIVFFPPMRFMQWGSPSLFMHCMPNCNRIRLMIQCMHTSSSTYTGLCLKKMISHSQYKYLVRTPICRHFSSKPTRGKSPRKIHHDEGNRKTSIRKPNSIPSSIWWPGFNFQFENTCHWSPRNSTNHQSVDYYWLFVIGYSFQNIFTVTNHRGSLLLKMKIRL